MYEPDSLGTNFSHLKPFERDFERATTFLYSSALQGNVLGLVTMSNRYEKGHGVHPSCDTAALYLGEVVRNISDSASFGGAELFQGFLAYRFSAASFGDLSVIDKSSVEYANEIAFAHVLDDLLFLKGDKLTAQEFVETVKQENSGTLDVDSFAHASDFIGRLHLLGVNEPQNVQKAFLHLEAAAILYENHIDALMTTHVSRFKLPSFARRTGEEVEPDGDLIYVGTKLKYIPRMTSRLTSKLLQKIEKSSRYSLGEEKHEVDFSTLYHPALSDVFGLLGSLEVSGLSPRKDEPDYGLATYRFEQAAVLGDPVGLNGHAWLLFHRDRWPYRMAEEVGQVGVRTERRNAVLSKFKSIAVVWRNKGLGNSDDEVKHAAGSQLVRMSSPQTIGDLLSVSPKYHPFGSDLFGDIIAPSDALLFETTPLSDMATWKNRLAFYYWNMSAFMGSTDAQFNLGAIYLTGMGQFLKNIDNNKALSWMVKASEGAGPSALYSLGQMHLNGLGSANKDCKMALRLFNQAVQHDLAVVKKLISVADRVVGFNARLAAFHLWPLADIGIELAASNFVTLTESGRVDFFMHARGNFFSKGQPGFKRTIADIRRMAEGQYLKEKSSFLVSQHIQTFRENNDVYVSRMLEDGTTFNFAVDITSPRSSSWLHSLVMKLGNLLSISSTPHDDPVSSLPLFTSRLSSMRYLWSAQSKGFLAQIYVAGRIASGSYILDTIFADETRLRQEMTPSTSQKKQLTEDTLYGWGNPFHNSVPSITYRDSGASLRTYNRLCPFPVGASNADGGTMSSADVFKIALADKKLPVNPPGIIGQYNTPFAPSGFQPPTIACLKLAKSFILHGGFPVAYPSLLSRVLHQFTDTELNDKMLSQHDNEYFIRLVADSFVFAKPLADMDSERLVQRHSLQNTIADMQRAVWALESAVNAEGPGAPLPLKLMLVLANALKKLSVHSYVSEFMSDAELKKGIEKHEISKTALIWVLSPPVVQVFSTLVFGALGCLCLVLIVEKLRRRRNILAMHDDLADDSVNSNARTRTEDLFAEIRASALLLSTSRNSNDNIIGSPLVQSSTAPHISQTNQSPKNVDILPGCVDHSNAKGNVVDKRDVCLSSHAEDQILPPFRLDDRVAYSEGEDGDEEDAAIEQSAKCVINRAFRDVINEFIEM